MYINPKHAIAEGWVKFPEWMDEDFRAKCIQPNAIDITLDKVFELDPTSTFILSEDEKVMKRVVEIHPSRVAPGIHHDQKFYAINHGCVDVMSDFFVDVPAGVAAFLIVRSTLNRNGLFVTSGLYDQGFKNNIGFILRNQSSVALIGQHTRVAQLVFVKAEDSGILYNGTYNQNEGEHWSSIDSAVTHNMVIPPLSEESTDVFIYTEDEVSVDDGVSVVTDGDRRVFSVDTGDTPVEEVVETLKTEMKKQRKSKQGE